MRLSGSTSVAANSTSANVLQGLVGSIIRNPSAVDLLAVQDGASGAILANFQIDAESVLIAGNIPGAPGAGQGPRDPEDVQIRNEAGPAGSILTLTFQNTTGAAVVVRWAVNIAALG